MYVQVMTNASDHQVRCKKQLPSGLVNVFTMKKEKVTIYGAFRNRTQFFIYNGTFKITNVERNDSGLYIIEAFDPNGVLVRNINVELDVQGKYQIILEQKYKIQGTNLCIIPVRQKIIRRKPEKLKFKDSYHSVSHLFQTVF